MNIQKISQSKKRFRNCLSIFFSIFVDGVIIIILKINPDFRNSVVQERNRNKNKKYDKIHEDKERKKERKKEKKKKERKKERKKKERKKERN